MAARLSDQELEALLETASKGPWHADDQIVPTGEGYWVLFAPDRAEDGYVYVPQIARFQAVRFKGSTLPPLVDRNNARLAAQAPVLAREVLDLRASQKEAKHG